MDTPENPIICLNYCMTDQETGYCLTCGRPPIPVVSVDLNDRKLGSFSLKALSITPSKTPEESS